jgi:hypothetical protein
LSEVTYGLTHAQDIMIAARRQFTYACLQRSGTH